jgi:hypothetical protein
MVLLVCVCYRSTFDEGIIYFASLAYRKTLQLHLVSTRKGGIDGVQADLAQSEVLAGL